MAIILWHGSRNWDGKAVIRPSKKGRAERGPGIYVTTHYETARDYAKGGGMARKLTLEPRLTLEQASLSLSDAADFVTSVISKSKQEDMLERFIRCAQTHRHENRVLLGNDNNRFHAETLINLCVNGDLATGKKGQALAEFLTEQGIDCSFSRAHGNETWGVIFNPKIIIANEPVSAKYVSLDDYVLPDPIKLVKEMCEPKAIIKPRDHDSLNMGPSI